MFSSFATLLRMTTEQMFCIKMFEANFALEEFAIFVDSFNMSFQVVTGSQDFVTKVAFKGFRLVALLFFSFMRLFIVTTE
jgi:hypothetical protein